jgi:hypothetical protein
MGTVLANEITQASFSVYAGLPCIFPNEVFGYVIER